MIRAEVDFEMCKAVLTTEMLEITITCSLQRHR